MSFILKCEIRLLQLSEYKAKFSNCLFLSLAPWEKLILSFATCFISGFRDFDPCGDVENEKVFGQTTSLANLNKIFRTFFAIVSGKQKRKAKILLFSLYFLFWFPTFYCQNDIYLWKAWELWMNESWVCQKWLAGIRYAHRINSNNFAVDASSDANI